MTEIEKIHGFTKSLFSWLECIVKELVLLSFSIKTLIDIWNRVFFGVV